MQQNLEYLKAQIPGCFGMDDLEFAGHFNDIEQARSVLIRSLKADVPLNAYLSMFKEYLESRGARKGHINEQMKRVMNLESYFTED